MTKKRHHHKPHIPLSSHAESKFQKHARRQKMITIGGAVFLGVIVLVVAIGLYIDRIAPMNETILRVNGRSFTMGYYVDALEVYSGSVDPSQMNVIADSIKSQIIRDEIVRQGAAAEGIVISSAEIREELKSADVKDTRMMRDLVEVSLASTQLHEHLRAQIPAQIEQVRFEIMLVESRSVATQVEAALAGGASMVDLSEAHSANPNIPVVQDWVPYELLANSEVAQACRTLPPNGTAVIHDPTASKNVGYWLLEVIDRDDAGAIHVRAILAANLEEAQRARERLETEDFATVAQQYSQIYDMAEGGDFGWFTPDDAVTEAFDAVAFDLELGVVSEPIRETEVPTSGGHWVVRLLEREERAPSDSVADALASTAFDEWYTQLSQQAVIEDLLTTEKKQWAIQRAM